MGARKRVAEPEERKIAEFEVVREFHLVLRGTWTGKAVYAYSRGAQQKPKRSLPTLGKTRLLLLPHGGKKHW